MDDIQYKLVRRALAKAGAKFIPYFRTPCDGNGVATGEPARIGCALGLYYNRSASNVLRIDIPGILIRGDNDHFECVLRAGCEPPHNGDLLGAERRKIINVSGSESGLYSLTLENK